jgi:thiol-disulfide isomerase/thioredoxin
MKAFPVIFLLFLSLLVRAQSDTSNRHKDTIKAVQNTTPPYLRNQSIPTFSIQLADSSWFFNTSLNPKKPVLILYFSPDCGHCQVETEEILARMNSLTELQIVMITSRPFEDMLNFIQHYKLHKFPGIVVGKDHARAITRFYDVRMTPFSALYNKKGKLVKAYKKGIDMNELIKLAQ